MEHPGASDCERVRGPIIGQPANALSSLGYLAAGAWLVRRGRGRDARSRRAHTVYGLALASNGIGSFAFHGPGGRAGRWLHDVAVDATLATVAVQGTLTVRGRRPRRGALALAAGAFGVAGLVYVRSRTDGRWCCPDCVIQGHAAWHLLTAVSLGALGVALLDADQVESEPRDRGR